MLILKFVTEDFMKVFYLYLVFIFVPFTLFGQNVVVSEYYNVTGDPNGEWTELLVIADNTSLVGFTLRDNAGSSGTPNQWTGGVRFKDHPLWRNIRSGTIIVVNHRYTAFQNVDIDKQDGYIEIDAENETYFEKRCFSCILGPDWYNVALNIAQESEIVEIIDRNDNHVHALAHMPTPSGSWLTMPDPKISAQGSITRSGVSVRVAPGRNLQAYNKGFDSRGDEVGFFPDYITKGKPNNRTGNIDQNQFFWRGLREPIWNNPTANAQVYKDSVVLTWNQQTDLNPGDSTQGYLILRIPLNQINSSQTPVDGRIYRIGDFLGSAIVVGVINYSGSTRFVDRFSLPCGEKFVYRVYAFRYRADDLREDIRPENGRGRSYNEQNYAEVQVEKPFPPAPSILVVDNKLKFCETDSAIITLNNPQQFLGNKIFWIFENSLIDSNHTEIVVKKKGTYKAKIIDSLGCSSFSNELSIEVVPVPKLTMLVNNKEITNDTTITICPNDSLMLGVYGWTSFRWYKNGVLIQEGKESSYVVSSSGIFWVQSSNDICTGETFKVQVKVLNTSIVLSTISVNLYLDRTQSYKDTVLLLSNSGDDTILINSISFTDTSFKLISPTVPIILPPKAEIPLVIRFAPLRAGLFSALMFIEKSCSDYDTIGFQGKKEHFGIIASKNIVDFGILPFCEGKEIFAYTELAIFNAGDEDVEIVDCYVEYPFRVVQPNFPITISKSNNVLIKFQYNIEKTGLDSGIVIIKFRTNNLIDSFKIPIRAESLKPDFEIVKLFAEPIEIGECQNEAKVRVLLRNKSKLPLNFTFLDSNAFVISLNRIIWLDAYDSAFAEFIIRPDRLGQMEMHVDFGILPCDIRDRLSFNILKKGIIVLFEPEEIDFGKLSTCRMDTTFRLLFSTKVITESGELVRVDSISITPPFFTDLSTGKILLDSGKFSIFFKSQVSGEFSGKMTVVISPCLLKFDIPIKATVEVGNYAVEPKELNFGPVEVGDFRSQRIILRNNGNIPIKLIGIEGIQSPFSLSNPGNLPIRIDTNQSLEVEVNFKPDSIIEYYALLQLVFGEPCNTIETIPIIGSGVQQSPKEILLFSDEIHSKPFRIIEIPIKIASNGTDSIRLSSLNFEIHFNHRLFNLFGISVQPTLALVDTIKSEGKVAFRFIFDSTKTLGTELAKLRGMVLLGDVRSTDFVYENAEATGTQTVLVRTQSGRLVTDSVCVIDLRLVQTETFPLIKHFEYEQNYLKLSFSNLTKDEALKIYIYNTLGNLVDKKNVDLISSENDEFIIPLTSLPEGIYLVRFELSGLQYFFKFIIF